MLGDWRREANRVIQWVLASLPADATEKQKRAALREAYPFRVRKYHPYKIWCSAVAVALGKKKVPKFKRLMNIENGPMPLFEDVEPEVNP